MYSNALLAETEKAAEAGQYFANRRKHDETKLVFDFLVDVLFISSDVLDKQTIDAFLPGNAFIDRAKSHAANIFMNGLTQELVGQGVVLSAQMLQQSPGVYYATRAIQRRCYRNTIKAHIKISSS